jgi:hypothetical protein
VPAPTISQQKTIAASQGNPDLREVLDSLSQVSTQTQTATSTTAISGTTAGQPNSAAARPAQATGSVSLLNGSYIVQLVNPGGKSAISQLQAAQSAQNATAQTSVQPVTPIYHQIRVSTSRAFNVNSNTQTFGGDTGQTQTYWTLTGLGTGTWYVQFRSSYDGVNWNTWKDANAGQTSLVETVTVETESNSVWALFSLPGGVLIGVGDGFAGDGATFGVPQGLYSSSMVALAGPNGFNAIPPQITDIAACAVIVPAANSGTVGIPDFPPVIDMKYGDRNNPQSTYSGNANFFAIAFTPSAAGISGALATYVSPDGNSEWTVITLPGGSKFAIGQGSGANGDTIFTPGAVPWISAANMLAICSIHGGAGTGRGAHGVNQCGLSGLTIEATYADTGSGSDVWPGSVDWMAVAWMPGRATATVQGGKWVLLNLGKGNQVAFGAGAVPAGSSFGLPSRYTQLQMLSIATPASFSGSGDNVMHAVSNCDIAGTTAQLSYVDGSGNNWSGDVNWFAFAWTFTPAVAPPAAGTVVSITPNNIIMNINQTVTFVATVTGNLTTTVTWSVDGVVGGNDAVGNITSGGVYTPPVSAGLHTITATSTAVPGSYSTASVSVTATSVGTTSGDPSTPGYIGEQLVDGGASTLYVYTSGGWVKIKGSIL